MDYGAGAARCKSSALAHRSAAYILKAFGGQVLGFAVSHAALAEEEASRAVSCAMVSKELVTRDTIKRVFREHLPKVYLFHALQRKKVVGENPTTTEENTTFDDWRQPVLTLPQIPAMHRAAGRDP